MAKVNIVCEGFVKEGNFKGLAPIRTVVVEEPKVTLFIGNDKYQATAVEGDEFDVEKGIMCCLNKSQIDGWSLPEITATQYNKLLRTARETHKEVKTRWLF